MTSKRGNDRNLPFAIGESVDLSHLGIASKPSTSVFTSLQLHPPSKEAVRSRCATAFRDLSRCARSISEQEYSSRAIETVPTPTLVDRKRHMRNKSAFISRQTQRHYEILLAEFLQKSESSRDEVLRGCICTFLEIQALQGIEGSLSDQLSSLYQSTQCDNVSRKSSDRFDETVEEITSFTNRRILHETALKKERKSRIMNVHQLSGSLDAVAMSHILDEAIGS